MISETFMNKNDIAASLTKIPGWDTKNAYEMTKLCCKELTLRGLQIDGWTNIREIIGKGSGTDITRGINAYLQEQAKMLYGMQGFIKEIPDEVAPHILGFWKCAIEHVGKDYAIKHQEWMEERETLQNTLSELYLERGRLQEVIVSLEAKLEQSNLKNAELADDFKQAQLKHALTEQQLDASNQELADQRNQLRDALEHAQKELNSALTRLEAAENHALLEVKRTKSDYEARISALESKLTALRHDHSLEIERHLLANSGLKNKAIALEHEKIVLNERLLRSEQQVDKLMAGLKVTGNKRGKSSVK
jgi:hypothetical protein